MGGNELERTYKLSFSQSNQRTSCCDMSNRWKTHYPFVSCIYLSDFSQYSRWPSVEHTLWKENTFSLNIRYNSFEILLIIFPF